MTNNEYVFEVCANSVESCIAAWEGGAQRAEICAAMSEGGITPSWATVRLARKYTSLRLHVMIRPRGGDFLYSPLELEVMENDILAAREAGADGVVFGCLTPEGEIDLPAMRRLMQAARGMSVTFHRAFDYVRQPDKALEQLIEFGVDRVLTSGQQPTAEQGCALLRTLVQQADGRIVVMPGCGINERNIAALAACTGAGEFHFSARVRLDSLMQLRNPALSMGQAGYDEYCLEETSADCVRQIIAALCPNMVSQ